MKNEYKIGLGISVLIAIIIAIIILTRKPSVPSGPSVPSVPSGQSVDKAVNDLESIRDRIKESETYREYYRSEKNNGLTVIGTLMEQMIDVMVAVLKQPLVAEAISKRIVNKQDADEIAEYIEILGKEVVKEVEQTQLLKCRKARMYVPCTGGTESCGMIEAEGDVPDSNCDAYEVNRMRIREGQRRAVANLYNKVLSVVEKAEERDKMYRIVKNISIDNATQYGISTGMSAEDIKSQVDNFQEQDKLETIAMAHYKYLGHELKREIGESINIRELTGEEEDKVRYLTDRNKGRESKNLVDVNFEIYEEPDYKGNNQRFRAKIPEGEVMKFGNSKNNPVKSLKLGENVLLEAQRVDNNEKIKLMGSKEDSNTGSGYYNVAIYVTNSKNKM